MCHKQRAAGLMNPFSQTVLECKHATSGQCHCKTWLTVQCYAYLACCHACISKCLITACMQHLLQHLLGRLLQLDVWGLCCSSQVSTRTVTKAFSCELCFVSSSSGKPALHHAEKLLPLMQAGPATAASVWVQTSQMQEWDKLPHVLLLILSY